MKYLLAAFALISFTAALASGSMASLSTAVVSACEDAIELFLSLLGIMAFWGGMMRIAERSHLADGLARIMSPILGLVFRKINKGSRAFSAVCLNVTANLMGLGNAATPLGINAMKEIKEETRCKARANESIALLTIFNTASIQILPTTIAAIRQEHGSENPMEIALPVLFTSFLSLAVGILTVKLFYIKKKA